MINRTALHELATVRVVAVKGPAMFELRRMFNGYVQLSVEGAAEFPVAALCGGDVAWSILTGDLAGVPVIRVGLVEGVGIPFNATHTVEHYDLSNHVARLSLLARVAQLVALSDARRQTHSRLPCDVFANRPLYYRVAIIQRVFALHISEQELAARTGTSESSLYRLFRQQGVLTPRTLLQWGRMHAMAVRLARGESVDRAAQDLGFDHGQSVRRSLRTLTRMPLRDLRSAEGLVEFERRMTAACRGG